MDAGSFRFGVGEFECVSVSDSALNYPPESLFSDVPLERVEEALWTSICRRRGYDALHMRVHRYGRAPRAGKHGCGRPGSTRGPGVPGLDHSTSVTGLLPENLRRRASNLPRSIRSSSPTPTRTTSAARWTRRESSFSLTPTTSSRKRSGSSETRRPPPRTLRTSWWTPPAGTWSL